MAIGAHKLAFRDFLKNSLSAAAIEGRDVGHFLNARGVVPLHCCGMKGAAAVGARATLL